MNSDNKKDELNNKSTLEYGANHTNSGLPLPPLDTDKKSYSDATKRDIDLTKLSTPLKPTKYERPNPVGRREIPLWMRDVLGLIIFLTVVLAGAWAINSFVFQSFNVVGPSMEPTLDGEDMHDRLIVNRMPVTMARAAGKQYVPSRGDIIVFKNPSHDGSMSSDEYIVKRVIGLPGDRITVENCKLLVYNQAHPDGYDPYPTFRNLESNDKEINTCVDGNGTNVTVPQNYVFVVGDHRIGTYSMDSRNGEGRATLGNIPLEDIVGPVTMRIWPANKFKVY